MTITSYGTGAYRSAQTGTFVSTRNQLDDLQRQLASKQRSESYGDLGVDRRTSLDLNAKISAIDSWQSGIQLAGVNLQLQTKAVENFATLASTTRTDMRSNSYVPSASGRSAPQILAEDKFKQTLDLLNTDVNGRYLFSGRTSDIQPTASFSEIFDGDGAGRAGLKQLVSERQTADGVTGLGRLVVDPTVGTTVAIGREAVNDEYGLNLKGASTNSAALVPTYAAGPPATLSVAVSAQPLPGENLRIQFNLPDGTQSEVTLTARAAGTSPAPADSFEIGVDATTTAANLRATVTAAIGRQAQTELRAASTSWTAKDFFEGYLNAALPADQVPKRVPASLLNPTAPGTDTDTVSWYKGEHGAGSARATATVQVDQNEIVGTGARASEQAFAVGLAQFAALAIEKFSATDPNSQAAYGALTTRVSDALGFGGGVQKPAEIITELGSAQTALSQAKDRHDSTKNYLTKTVEGVENVTTEEVAVQILALQNQLNASYQVTSILSKLSLTNYL